MNGRHMRDRHAVIMIHLQLNTCLKQQARSKEGSFTGENLSPRSKRFMSLLPKPKTPEAMVLLNLKRIKAQVAHGMDQIKSVQSLASSFLKEYFERIPPVQVPFIVFC